MMDRWLAAIGNDRSPDAPAVKVARNRPADVADACFTEQGERIVEPASYTSQGRCNQLYPPHADPRIAAGAPLTNDILKCELKPIEATDYPLPFTHRANGAIEGLVSTRRVRLQPAGNRAETA